MPEINAIGISTGTSFDAVDLVQVRFANKLEIIDFASLPIPSELRKLYRKCYNNQETNVSEIAYLDSILGELFVEGTELLKAPEAADVIGCSGQTIWHQITTKPHTTWQIGDVTKLAAKLKIPVVSDFRKLDLAFGGQGAPLAPIIHKKIFPQDHGIVNIGGIANISAKELGFDLGPGNCLLDQSIQEHDMSFDRDGNIAKTGKVCRAALEQMLAEPYFNKKPPKTTGLELFNKNWLEKFNLTLSLKDLLATLTELTAITISNAASDLPLIICGGGAYNKFLLQRLTTLHKNTVVTSLDFGYKPCQIEGLLFADLAISRIQNQPVDAPCGRKLLLGSIFKS
jgi:anhydro-N-acetylmuramic acid kinase